MKRIIKCGTAFLLALVLCLCLLPTTAFAASNQVYIWNFPLSDDTLKSSGNWGHGVLDLRFGYRVGASSYTQFRCLDSWQGEVAYCIEPGAPQKNYDSLTDHNDTWWDHLTLPDGHPLTPREVQRLIGRIMSYGYHGTIGGGWWADVESTAEKMAWAYATQVLIWEVVAGERDSSFRHIDVKSMGYNEALERVDATHPLRGKILSYYDSIAELPEEVSDALELPENEQALVLPTQEADVSVSTVDVNTAGDAAQQQIRPEGMHAIAEYTDLFANTDLKYDLTAGRLKESIIIQQPEDALLGYRYHLEASGLTLTLQEDRSILAYAAGAAEGDRPVYYMPAPFLLDDEQAYSTDVQVQLLEVDGGYDLYYLLPVEWMSDSNRAYPVVLDPVLQPVSNTYTIRDQSVFEKDQFSPFWGMVECGYNPRHYRERIFMKFKNLPKLTSADVIVSASVSMLKSGTDEPIVIEAHQVNGDWDSEDITWTNQPSHNSNVEDYQTVDQGEKWYTWDITHIAQTWYEDNKNTGVMFRMQDWVESGKTGEHWE